MTLFPSSTSRHTVLFFVALCLPLLAFVDGRIQDMSTERKATHQTSISMDLNEPTAILGTSSGGAMKASEFKSYSELTISPQSCVLKGFRLVYVPEGEDISVSVNPGGKYQAMTKRLADKAKAGDKYFYENIKCKCEGEPGTRKLTSLAVNIE